MKTKRKSITGKRPAAAKSKYDSAWKKVIKDLFQDFLEFFYPEIYKAIDFSKEITFLDKELNEIMPDTNLGDRVADVLVKVHLLDGLTTYIRIIIHIEVQGDAQADFMDRMWIYYYRAFDKEVEEKIPVISVAMLTDDNPNFRQDVYEFKLFGFEIRMKIPVVKILDYKHNRELQEKLESSPNPMTMIAKAQLKSLEVKKANADKKFEVTKELIRQCYRHGYSKDTTRTIMQFFAWVIRLPDSLKDRIKNVIKQAEEEFKMEYVPIWEKDILEEGIKKGKREGIQEGKREGKLETARELLKKGVDINIIASATGFSKKEIEELAKTSH
jgi:predicted transposase/invertase (TIGR01784 family)